MIKFGRRFLELKNFLELFFYVLSGLSYWGLNPVSLIGKRVLEVGSGNRQFAGLYRLIRFPAEIYSLDFRFAHFVTDPIRQRDLVENLYNMGILDKEDYQNLRSLPKSSDLEQIDRICKLVNQRTVVAAMEKIPFWDNSFDLVVNGVMPGYEFLIGDASNERLLEDSITKSLAEMLRVVKHSGEVRLASLHVGGLRKYYDRYSRIFMKELSRLAETGKYEIYLEPLDSGYNFEEYGYLLLRVPYQNQRVVIIKI